MPVALESRMQELLQQSLFEEYYHLGTGAGG